MKQVILTLLLGGSALAGSAGQAHTGHGSHGGGEMAHMMTNMLQPLQPLSGKAFDIEWTKAMIDHHQMAVDMARHAAVYGKNLTVRNAAQQVINTQEKEISAMQGWLNTWTGQSYQPKAMPMTMNHMGSMDKWFLEGMIPHHQGAIDMAKLVPSRTKNANVRRMAQDIIRVQSAEIAQYRQWLKKLP